MSELEARNSIIATSLEMAGHGITHGTSGNVSMRFKDGFLITPSGVPYSMLDPADIVFMTLDGKAEGALKPSSEWRIHRDIFRAKPDINAVVHAHPPYATIIAIMGLSIPPLHYMIAVGGGSTIPCAPYATFGTEELSHHVLAALTNRTACLLAHHGMVATGPTLERALWLAVEVEELARQYFGCLQIGGPRLLPGEEIERVLAKFGDYGQRSAVA